MEINFLVQQKVFYMTLRVSQVLIALHILVLLVGTQMPDAWRNGAVQIVHAPLWLSSFGHFVLFAGMAMVLAARPLAWTMVRIVLAALALALLSEGVQFLAIDRHPRWVDVGIDMAGALAAVGLIKLGFLCFVRR